MKMKKPKNHKITAIIIGIVTIAVVIICAIILTNLGHRYGNYKIPDGYISTYRNDMQYIDGPNMIYYIYSDKIILEETSVFPSGSPHGSTRTIKLYRNITDIKDITPDNGEVIAEEYQ